VSGDIPATLLDPPERVNRQQALNVKLLNSVVSGFDCLLKIVLLSSLVSPACENQFLPHPFVTPLLDLHIYKNLNSFFLKEYIPIAEWCEISCYGMIW